MNKPCRQPLNEDVQNCFFMDIFNTFADTKVLVAHLHLFCRNICNYWLSFLEILRNPNPIDFGSKTF